VKKKIFFSSFRLLEGGDEITGPKMGPCDEITSPFDKITGPKKTYKKTNKEVNF
jgi:hypothetical protein